MCYPKPGPRCSAHAAKRLTLAKLNLETGSYNEYSVLRSKVEEAEKEYEATPAGMAELKRRIRDSGNVQHEMRLKLAQTTRAQQLAALKASDVGDITHDETGATSSYSRSQFLSARKVRKAFDLKSEDMINLVEDSHRWISSLSPEEIEAVAWYTSNGAGSLNSYLIKGEDESPFHYEKEHLEAQIKYMDSALSKANRVSPVVVYRGVSSSKVLNTVTGERKEAEKAFKVGEVFSSAGYMSASVDSGVGAGYGDVVLEIKSFSAAPVVNVSAWDVTEKEMVIPRNKQFKVVNVVPKVMFEERGGGKKASRMVVQLEEI